jgi:DNA (cytosine-5)-methyltransferase 1
VLTAIDLFAGAGGASSGIQAAGFRLLGAVESDPFAAASYRANFPDASVFEGDIRLVDPVAVMARLGLGSGELTLMQACPPCQTWSSLGRHRTDDERNDLVFEVTRFARILMPSVLVVENVRGLTMDSRFNRLRARLNRLGYGSRLYKLDAADYGVPQRRVRLVLLAIRGLDGRQFPSKIRPIVSGPSLTVGAAFAALRQMQPLNDPLDRSRRHSDTVKRRIAALPLNGTRFDLPDDLILDCHRDLSARSATASYGRLRGDRPAATLTTRCTTPACGPYVHPSEDRGITLREAAWLQTFPLRHVFVGGYGAIERQIGNALPPLLARAVAQASVQLLRRSMGAM